MTTLTDQLDAALERHDNGFGDAKCYEFLADNADTLRAALRDAARYRWLRHMIYDERIITAQNNQASMLHTTELDAAIDSAMEACGDR